MVIITAVRPPYLLTSPMLMLFTEYCLPNDEVTHLTKEFGLPFANLCHLLARASKTWYVFLPR